MFGVFQEIADPAQVPSLPFIGGISALYQRNVGEMTGETR